MNRPKKYSKLLFSFLFIKPQFEMSIYSVLLTIFVVSEGWISGGGIPLDSAATKLEENH